MSRTPVPTAKTLAAPFPPEAPGERIVHHRLWWVGLAAAAVGSAGNLLVYRLAVSSGGFAAGSPLPWPVTIVGVTTLAAAGGAVGLAALGRLTRRPVSLFRLIAVATLAFSFGGPVLAGAGLLPDFPRFDAGTVLALMAMHTLAAATIVGLLSKLATRATTAAPVAHPVAGAQLTNRAWSRTQPAAQR
jgi:hypothetical protein